MLSSVVNYLRWIKAGCRGGEVPMYTISFVVVVVIELL